MQIKIDMLLIIFKPDSVVSHPASCTLLLKISNNHKGQQSSHSFPKSNCWTQVNVAGSQLRTNKAIALSQPEQSSFQQSEKLLFLTVTDSAPISIKMTSCITVMTWQTLRYRTYQSAYSHAIKYLHVQGPQSIYGRYFSSCLLSKQGTLSADEGSAGIFQGDCPAHPFPPHLTLIQRLCNWIQMNLYLKEFECPFSSYNS